MSNWWNSNWNIILPVLVVSGTIATLCAFGGVVLLLIGFDNGLHDRRPFLEIQAADLEHCLATNLATCDQFVNRKVRVSGRVSQLRYDTYRNYYLAQLAPDHGSKLLTCRIMKGRVHRKRNASEYQNIRVGDRVIAAGRLRWRAEKGNRTGFVIWNGGYGVYSNSCLITRMPG